MNTALRQKLVYPAVVGAAYAALTMLLAPISYAAIQCRVSEVLCILPFFLPETAVGLFVGCAVANTISAAGILDVVFGSLATLLAGLCTAYFGRSFRRSWELPSLGVRALACLMPVLWNGVIIGAVLSWSFTPEAFWPGFLLMGAEVAAGEAVVMLLAALPLMGPIRRALRPYCFSEQTEKP